MKRCWQTGLAIFTTLALFGAANAQPDELGTYQSILARAGYDHPNAVSTNHPSIGYPQSSGRVPPPPGSPLEFSTPVPTGSTRPFPIGQPLTEGLACGKPVQTLDPIDGEGCAPKSNSTWVFGVFGVNLRRDYEDRRRIAYNGAGDDLFTTDASNGNFSGVGVSLGKRYCNGSGWEAIFWGLSTSAEVTLAGPTSTYLSGFSDLNHVPSGATAWAIYNAGDDVQLCRHLEMYDFEFNLLRNGGKYTAWGGACANYELLAGFRLFQFNEELRYASSSSAPGYPNNMEYSLDAENTLAGFQVGGRNQICLSRCLRVSGGVSFGLFNNHIETQQSIVDETAYSPLIGSGPAAGNSFDYGDTKNDAAVLGQFDLGLIYQCSQKARVRIGYRAMGVAGVALAADQIPVDFTDPYDLENANANGELLLQGLVYGLEFCY
jgi:hypothetical protein